MTSFFKSCLALQLATFLSFVQTVVSTVGVGEDQPFAESLLNNVLSYAFIIAPAAYLVHYFKKNPERLNGESYDSMAWSVQVCPSIINGFE